MTAETLREAVARAIEGPHCPVPAGCKWTLDQLRAVRWGCLSQMEKNARLNEADAALIAIVEACGLDGRDLRRLAEEAFLGPAPRHNQASELFRALADTIDPT